MAHRLTDHGTPQQRRHKAHLSPQPKKCSKSLPLGILTWRPKRLAVLPNGQGGPTVRLGREAGQGANAADLRSVRSSALPALVLPKSWCLAPISHSCIINECTSLSCACSRPVPSPPLPPAWPSPGLARSSRRTSPACPRCRRLRHRRNRHPADRPALRSEPHHPATSCSADPCSICRSDRRTSSALQLGALQLGALQLGALQLGALQRGDARRSIDPAGPRRHP